MISVYKAGVVVRTSLGLAALAAVLMLGTDYVAENLAWAKQLPGGALAAKALLLSLSVFVAACFWLRRELLLQHPSSSVSDPVRSAYDVLSEGVVVLNVSGQIMFANEAFQKLSGQKAPLIGQPLEKALSIDPLRAEYLDEPLPWHVALRNHTAVLGERVDLPRPEAQNYTMIVSCTPLLDDKTAMRGCLVVFVDRTEIERTNVDLSQALTQLKLSSAKIELQNEELRRLATTDPLTGALNRRAFFERAQSVCERSRATDEWVSVMLVDIDFFKAINDHHGHQVGDRAIEAIAKVLIGTVGNAGLVCRYGGEEFCVLLANANSSVAAVTAESIRARIEAECGIGLKRERVLRITASLGIASLDARSANVESLIAGADKALYRAKREGRNRVCQFESTLDDSGSRKVQILA